MKNRIIAVILSVLVGIGCFSTVLYSDDIHAYADGTPLSFVSDWFSFMYEHSIYKLLQDNPSVTSDIGQYVVLTSIREYGEERNLNYAELRNFLDSLFSEYPSFLSFDFSERPFLKLWTGILIDCGWDTESAYQWIIDPANGGYHFDKNGNFNMPSEGFKDVIAEQNKTLTPKNKKLYKYSWREISDNYSDYSSFYFARAIGSNGEFIDNASFADGVYIYPYAFVGTTLSSAPVGQYYSQYQFHIYREQEYGDSFVGTQGESYPNVTYTWYADALSYLLDTSGEPLEKHTIPLLSDSSSFSNGVYSAGVYNFITVGFGGNFVFDFLAYDNQANCLLNPTVGFTGHGDVLNKKYGNLILDYYNFIKSDDVAVTLKRSGFMGFVELLGTSGDRDYFSFTRTFSSFAQSFPDDSGTDYGFLVSAEPFTTTYLFDITRIPSNSTITITGDTVYDYVITDNSTGDSTTINNFVENNYYYPENSGGNGSGGSGGGSMSGDITVGGKVEVGGSVDVNVNVDVTTGNVGNYGDMPDMSPVDGFLQDALDESSGIRSFLGLFFEFLPDGILMLMGIGLTLVILARIFGR